MVLGKIHHLSLFRHKTIHVYTGFYWGPCISAQSLLMLINGCLVSKLFSFGTLVEVF